MSVQIALHLITLTFFLIPGQGLTFSDDIAEQACGPERPAVLTEPGIAFAPPMENGTYKLNMTCHWLIQAPGGSVARLEFPLIEMDWTYECAYAELTVYDAAEVEEEHYLERYCGNATAPPMYSSHEHLLVVFWAGHKGRGRGFQANYTFNPVLDTACSAEGPFHMDNWTYGGLTTPCWPAYYPPLAACSWLVSATNPIRLEFTDFALESYSDNLGCVNDNVTVFDVAKPQGENVIGVFCGPFLPDNIGATGDSLLVVFHSNSHTQQAGLRARFQARNISEWSCSASKPAELDFSPGLVVSPHSEWARCDWRLHAPLSTMIRLWIVTFDLPDCADCACAGLDVYDGETHNHPQVGRYCGGGWGAGELVFSGEYAYLEYDSQQLAPHAGFTLEYVFYRTAEHACGAERPLELTQASGVITSPHYDKGHYPDHANCQWRISAPFGYVVALEVYEFALEYCYGCQCDYVRLYNGAWPQEAPVMDTWCGSERPQALRTTQTDAYVTFSSDSHGTDDGFRIKFRAEHLANRACNMIDWDPANMAYEPGTVLSPGYELGEPYPPNSHCEWLITSSQSKHRVALTVQTLDVEWSENCAHDSLTLYDGRDTTALIIDKLCGDEKKTWRSTGNVMLLKFISNDVVERNGFYLTYTFEEDEEGGMGVVPLLLISLASVFLLALLCVCCGCSARIKKAATRVRGRRAGGADSGVTTAATDACPDYHALEPQAISAPPQVDRPPSQVDNLLYYAIANYPPPTYEEAMLQNSQSQASVSSQSRGGMPDSQASSNTGNEGHITLSAGDTHTASDANVSSDPLDQNSLPDILRHTNANQIQYPFTRQTSQQTRLPLRNSVNMGNPDVGVGILSVAGVLPAVSSAEVAALPASAAAPLGASSQRTRDASTCAAASQARPVPNNSGRVATQSANPLRAEPAAPRDQRDKAPHLYLKVDRVPKHAVQGVQGGGGKRGDGGSEAVEWAGSAGQEVSLQPGRAAYDNPAMLRLNSSTADSFI